MHTVKNLITKNVLTTNSSAESEIKERYDVRLMIQSIIMAIVFYSNFSNSMSTPCMVATTLL